MRKGRASDYRGLLALPGYRLLLLANLVNRFGDSVDAVAQVWIVYQISGSASLSALTYALNCLPSVLVQPFAGALVEAWPKRWLMAACDWARFLFVTVIAVCYMAGTLTTGLLMLLTLCISTAEAFRHPAGTALMPLLLPERLYDAGISLSQSLGTTVELVMFGLGGLLVASWGAAAGVLTDAATFLLSGLLIVSIRVREPGAEGKEKPRWSASLREGLLYARGHGVLLRFCLVAVLLNAAAAPTNALLTPLVVECLHRGAEFVGAVNLCVSLGILLGSLLYPLLARRVSAGWLLCMSGAGAGLGLCGLPLGGLTSNGACVLLLSGSAALLLGMSIGLIQCCASVGFLRVVDQRFLARSAALFNAAGSAAAPVASAAMSGLAAFLPVQWIFVTDGALCAILFLVLRLSGFEPGKAKETDQNGPLSGQRS